MPRRPPLSRVLAAAATFSVGALLVGALTFGLDANADKPAPPQVASLAPAQTAPPPKAEAQKEAQPEAPKIKKSHARRFLPVQSFGGY